MKKTVGVVGALLFATVGSFGALVLMVGGAGGGQAAATTCTTGTTPTNPAALSTSGTGASLPASIGSYDAAQVANAAQIITAAKNLGIDARGQAVGVMTAIGESTLTVVDHGDGPGPDSRGLFQQRANGAWGSYTDRMDPTISATSFFKALIGVPGWESMAPTLAAHTVQRNADPYHYERFWDAAVQIVSTLSGDPDLASKLPATAALPCSPAQTGTFTGTGTGDVADQACSVVPDPTTGRGCLTPRMLALVTQLQAQNRRLSCWDPHLANPRSDHPNGKACDVFPGEGGVMPTAEQKADSDALAASLQATATQTGIKYLIWYGQIWLAAHPDRGWQPYNGAGVYDPGSVVGGHFDHIHISVY
jgi:hypothetical protein